MMNSYDPGPYNIIERQKAYQVGLTYHLPTRWLNILTTEQPTASPQAFGV